MSKPLSHKELVGLAQEHERKAAKPPFGYPVSLISRIISRCLFIEKEKNKWKRLAQSRGEAMLKIKALAEFHKLLDEEVSDGSGDIKPVSNQCECDSDLSGQTW
jgi:hypothetical protein